MKLLSGNKLIKWQSIGLLFFLVLKCAESFSVEVISVDENFSTENITADCGYLQLQKCDTVFFSRAFHTIGRDHFSMASLASCILIEVRVENQTSEEQLMTLELVNPYLYDVKYSIGQSDGGIDGNSLMALSSESTLHPRVDFDLEPYSREVIYLLIPVQYHSTFFNIHLSKRRSFLQADFTNIYFINAVIGGLFTYLIIIIVLAMVSRNRLLVRYALIDFWVMLFIWVDSGLASNIWLSGAPLAQNLMLLVIGLGYLGSIIFFIRAFFDLKEKHRNVAIFLNGLFFALFLLAIFAFYTEQANSFLVLKRKVLIHIVNSFLLVTLALFYFLGFTNYLKTKKREVLWFLGAFVLHIVTWFFVLCYKGYFTSGLSALDDLPFHLFGLYSNIPFITYAMLLVEMLTVSYFIILGFKGVVDDYSLSLEKIKEQESEYLEGLISGQNQERKNIERTLEDTILDRINTVESNLHSLALFERDAEVKGALIEEVKDLKMIKAILTDVADDFIQSELLTLSFCEAIEQIFEQAFSNQKNMQVVLNCDLSNRTFSTEFRNNIFRITQELLNNVIKHAEATTVWARFNYEHDLFFMQVEDDGIGLNAELDNSSGMGLKNIENKIESMNGTVKLVKGELGGLCILIQIQLLAK